MTGGLAGAFIALAGPDRPRGGRGRRRRRRRRTAVLRDSGFKNKDLEEVGSLMRGRPDRSCSWRCRPDDADRLRSVLDDEPEFKAADRRWEATLDGDSKNVLHEAIAQYQRASRPRRSGPSRAETASDRRGVRRVASVGVGGQVVRGRAVAEVLGVVRSAPAGSWDRTTRCGRGISMPLAWSAASSRLRNSPPAAHCSVARTLPRILSVTPYSPSASTRSTRGRLEDAPLPLRLAGHRPADVVDDADGPVDVGAVGDGRRPG